MLRRRAVVIACWRKEGRPWVSRVRSASYRECDPVRSTRRRPDVSILLRTCAADATVSSTLSCPSTDVRTLSPAPSSLVVMLLPPLLNSCCCCCLASLMATGAAHAWPVVAASATAANATRRTPPIRMFVRSETLESAANSTTKRFQGSRWPLSSSESAGSGRLLCSTTLRADPRATVVGLCLWGACRGAGLRAVEIDSIKAIANQWSCVAMSRPLHSPGRQRKEEGTTRRRK